MHCFQQTQTHDYTHKNIVDVHVSVSLSIFRYSLAQDYCTMAPKMAAQVEAYSTEEIVETHWLEKQQWLWILVLCFVFVLQTLLVHVSRHVDACFEATQVYTGKQSSPKTIGKTTSASQRMCAL